MGQKDPQKEIYDINMKGTRNTIEAAAEAEIKRIIYVSSIAEPDYTQLSAKGKHLIFSGLQQDSDISKAIKALGF